MSKNSRTPISTWFPFSIVAAIVVIVAIVLLILATRILVPGFATWLPFANTENSPTADPDQRPGADETDTEKAPGESEWYSLRNSDGLAFVTQRQAGIDHLIIYVGNGADGAAELQTATAQLRKGGFDLLSHRPAPETLAPSQTADSPGETVSESDSRSVTTGELDDDRLRDFLELATARPGYRKRVLILHGRRLRAGLEFLAGAPRSVTTLIVLRPGDARRDRTEIVAAARLLPEELRIVWVSSKQQREAAAARKLQAALARAKIAPGFMQSSVPGLETANARLASDFRLRLSENLFYELLLMQRTELSWSGAADVFAAGCGYSSQGPRDVYLGGMQVSGERDQDFCPLFLRRDGRAMYHAEEITEEYCVYRVADGRTRLYCAYD
ncbi:MAG: hypothetical protein NXI24_18090 [bacterium]|nr:hypothetical protein [bacterium]